MKEIVIISGKGGTGKTSVVAAFASLAQPLVLVDCDVDAADLHLVLAPDVREVHDFHGGKTARIRQDGCRGCGVCVDVCRFGAVSVTPEDAQSGRPAVWEIDPVSCEGCGVCAHCCPHQAIAFEEACNGQWFLSETRVGPMVHARLGIAEENSGKLVALIRREAQRVATARGLDLVLVDGPPGIGCPVIASLSGADHVVIVTEPTVSGIHDMERVVSLAAHFRVPASVIINKADLNPEHTAGIVQTARGRGVGVLGDVPYDDAITRAQLAACSVVEYGASAASAALREVWSRLGKVCEVARHTEGLHRPPV